MSADVMVFHSSEVDPPLPEGWYIGSEDLAVEPVGPYETKALAAAGAARGDWLKSPRAADEMPERDFFEGDSPDY